MRPRLRYRLLQPGPSAAPARHCAPPSVSNSQLARRGGRRDKLFCALTCHIVNKQAASIEKHIRGKKYCKAKGAARACHRLRAGALCAPSLRSYAWAGPQSCWSGASTRCWRSRTSRAARCAVRTVGPAAARLRPGSRWGSASRARGTRRPGVLGRQEDASLVVTEARCAGGDELDAAGPSGKGGDVMMEVDRVDKALVAGVAPTNAAAFDAVAQARCDPAVAAVSMQSCGFALGCMRLSSAHQRRAVACRVCCSMPCMYVAQLCEQVNWLRTACAQEVQARAAGSAQEDTQVDGWLYMTGDDLLCMAVHASVQIFEPSL